MIQHQDFLQFFILFVLTYSFQFLYILSFSSQVLFLFHPILSQSPNSWFQHNLFSQAISLCPPLLYTDQIILIQSMIMLHFFAGQHPTTSAHSSIVCIIWNPASSCAVHRAGSDRQVLYEERLDHYTRVAAASHAFIRQTTSPQTTGLAALWNVHQTNN